LAATLPDHARRVFAFMGEIGAVARFSAHLPRVIPLSICFPAKD
jgi:hypothetical protein